MEFASFENPDGGLAYIESRLGDDQEQFKDAATIALEHIGIAVTPAGNTLLVTLNLQIDAELDARRFAVQTLNLLCQVHGVPFEEVHAFLESCRLQETPHPVVHIHLPLPLRTDDVEVEAARTMLSSVTAIGYHSVGVDNSVEVVAAIQTILGEEILLRAMEAAFLENSIVHKEQRQRQIVLQYIGEQIHPALADSMRDISQAVVSSFFVFGAVVVPTADGLLFTISFEHDDSHDDAAATLLPIFLRDRFGIEDWEGISEMIRQARNADLEAFHYFLTGIDPGEYLSELQAFLEGIGARLAGGDIDEFYEVNIGMIVESMPEIPEMDE